MSTNATKGVETLVIGGGQAGLAVGQQLATRGIPCLIADANPEVGAVWRSRWDSLRLFTSGRYNNLPGMDFPGARDEYPGKDQAADFLQAYARKFDLPVQLDTRIESLTREDGGYVARSGAEEIRAEQVVVATGPFHLPFTPPIADQLDPALAQMHSADYRNPGELATGRTLVVGAANSGQQIALELAGSRQVDIAVGERLKTLPQQPLGRDIWWWLSLVGIPRITVASRLGKRLSERDLVIGGGLGELERAGVTIRSRVAGASGRTITFDDGSAEDYDAVVWATGFRVDHSWVEIPETKDEAGRIRHIRGVTESPGLYLLGMTWQHTRTSALLGWVGEDAAYLADQIEARRAARGGSEMLTPTAAP
jgi:putative flavoprotein involved in K+ transport